MFKSAIFLHETFLTHSFLLSTYRKDLGLETAQIVPTDYFYRTVITQGMGHKILRALQFLRRLARRQIGAIKNENRRKNITLIFIDTLIAYSDVLVFEVHSTGSRSSLAM